MVAADAVQGRFEPSADEGGDRRAADHSDECHHHALEQDASKHDTSGRAERHPDADVAGALHYLALGAGRTAIARLILRETSVLLAIGAGVGVVLALAGGRAASTLLFGVRPYDPLALFLSLAALVAIGFVASYAPARRAMRIEPVTALRAD